MHSRQTRNIQQMPTSGRFTHFFYLKSPKSWQPSTQGDAKPSGPDQLPITVFLHISRKLKPSDGNMYRKKLFKIIPLTTYSKVIETREECAYVNNYRKYIYLIIFHAPILNKFLSYTGKLFLWETFFFAGNLYGSKARVR